MELNRETIALTHFQVSEIDAACLPKSSKATYGLGHFYNSKASHSERGLKISMIAVVDVESTIAYFI